MYSGFLQWYANRRLIPSDLSNYQYFVSNVCFNPDIRFSHPCLGEIPTTAASSCWLSYLFCFRPDLPPHTYRRPSRPEKT